MTAEPVDRLLRLGHSLAAEFGHEYSCKWGPGTALPDRHLLTFAACDVAGGAAALCDRLTADLGFAPAAHGPVLALWPMASHVHIGLECEPAGRVWKVYLESPRGLRVPGVAQEPGWRKIHRAFKWHESTPQAVAVTDYDALLAPGLPPRQALVAAALQGHPPLQQAMDRLLQHIARTQAGAEAMLLRVTDPNTRRISVDINLYPLGWTVADGRAWLLEWVACCGADVAPVQAWADREAAQALGHLAAGLSAQGQPFVTAYHGMHGCSGGGSHV